MRHRGWRRHHRERLIQSRLHILRNIWHEDPDLYCIAGDLRSGEDVQHEFAVRWATSRRTLCSCPMCKWNRSVPPWGREPTRQEVRAELDMRDQMDDLRETE